ncbi:hypothetical protein C0995_006792 [Termitomyces sp. Mi166|nr:hypothetical protein C0995_006792 [Termitomyces sp. Mi166\
MCSVCSGREPQALMTTDPRTPEQYDGLIVTQQKAAAVSKSKEKVVPTLSDESDYGESLSMHERESEEGESVAQHFQCVQYNKKLAAKKVRKAKAEAALQHRAINDFSGRIPDGLEVKVWGPLNVERLNSCFRGALSDCVYYSVHNNTIFIGADANWAAAFKYSAHQRAKMPASLVYKDLQSPIRGKEDMDFVVPRHILTCFTHVKEDGMTALHVMCAPDPSQPFNLEQIVQYALIFGQLGLENTWQSIAFDFAYRMHWQTLFGFTLCWALCATSAAKPAVVRRSHLNLMQVYVPDKMAQNFSDDDTLRVLLHNQILLDWVDHAYTYGMVYLEQQFHSPMMSMDIFREIDNKRLQRLSHYGTPPAIPQ